MAKSYPLLPAGVRRTPELNSVDDLSPQYRNGCVALFKCGPNGWRELITGKTPTEVNSPKYTPCRDGGHEMISGASQEHIYFSNANIPNFPSSGPFTVFVFCRDIDTGINNNGVLISHTDFSANAGWSINSQTYPSTLDVGATKLGVADLVLTNLESSNVSTFYAVKFNSSDQLTGFTDEGSQTDSNSSAIVTTGLDTITISAAYRNGGLVSNSGSDAAVGPYILVWNRELSDAEITAIGKNPHVLRRSFTDFYLVPTAAATTVGQASETDSALSITPVKQVAVGQSSETDSSLSITPAKSTSIGQPSETDAALSVSPARIVDVGQATETDTALSISTSTTAEVGLSSESDSALSVTPSKVVNVGIASETDSALTITPSGVTAVGQATETDTALNIDPLKQVNLGQPSETDTALSITPARGVSVGLASEADSALGITHRKEVQVGLATETDTAFSITDGSPSPLQVTCTLVTRSGAAIPNLTALSWAWFDAVDPNLFGAPSDQGEVETTDGSGVIEVSLPSTTLTAGQSGTLVLRADDGSSLGAYNLAVASA